MKQLKPTKQTSKIMEKKTKKTNHKSSIIVVTKQWLFSYNFQSNIKYKQLILGL
jgi:hypothetical protein